MCYVNKYNKPQIICGDFNRIVSEIDGYNLWIYRFFQIILIKNQKIILGGHIVEIQEGKTMNIG